MARTTDNKSVIERFLLTSRNWSEGYRVFNRLFGKPLGWMFIIQDGKNKLIRLDQKGYCSFYAGSRENEAGCAAFLTKYLEQLKHDPQKLEMLPNAYKCAWGRNGLIFPIEYLNQVKGFVVLCATKKSERETRPFVEPFRHFLKSQVDLAYKTFELQNFYETVHPRALALSTMHSVHRVISSTLHLNELLPRIGRLCAQVLKAECCSVYLIDDDGSHLVPQFSLAGKKTPTRKTRLRVGKGVEGHVAETAEFHLTNHAISVPLIEEDVIGVISLRNKVDGESFGKMDLEILKAISEQAVVAIKNAKLFEETERLTVSSIQAINELLELSYGRKNMQVPLFSEIVFEIGRDIHLSSMDLTNLHRATLLIDTGYLGTPEHILAKKSRLTKSEFETIKRHPALGASVLKKMGSLKPVIPMILHHHERFDGKGYPHGLKGDEIPIGARIIAIVDAFIAMLSKRPYRSPKTVGEAIEEIQHNAGVQFDPAVVKSFLVVVARPEMLKKIERLRHMDPQDAHSVNPASRLAKV